jgi:chromodomain-helicase-DNA-binding protein 1
LDGDHDGEPAAARSKAKKAKGSGKKKQHGGSSEPGPPVEGAVLRVDEWLLDVDETGRPLPKQVRLVGSCFVEWAV